MAKSRSWIFPWYPSAAAGVALLAYAGCQPAFLVYVCLTIPYVCRPEVASLREEDSGVGRKDDAAAEEQEEEEADDPVLQMHVLVVRCAFLKTQNSVLQIQCSFLGVRRSKWEQLPLSASPRWSTQKDMRSYWYIISVMIQILNRCISRKHTALPWSLGFFLVGQQPRPRKDTQTAKQRAENTSCTTQVTIRGTQRIRVVLWGERKRRGVSGKHQLNHLNCNLRQKCSAAS